VRHSGRDRLAALNVGELGPQGVKGCALLGRGFDGGQQALALGSPRIHVGFVPFERRLHRLGLFVLILTDTRREEPVAGRLPLAAVGDREQVQPHRPLQAFGAFDIDVGLDSN
jgi:hypothetical protein